VSQGQTSDGRGWRKLSILSTEDDPQIRVMLSELLEPEGHEITFARNSDDFFNLIDKRKYDLLILDVNVPGLNGYQIARAVGEKFGSKRPKMLLFTGRDTQAEKGLVAISGVDAVLEKGTPLPVVVETINQLTGISGGPLGAGPGPSPAPEPKRKVSLLDTGELPLSMGPLAAEVEEPEYVPREDGGAAAALLEDYPTPTASAASRPSEPAMEPMEPPAGEMSKGDLERLRNRVNTVVSENASLSRRIDAMQRRVSDMEKLAKDIREGAQALRLVVVRVGGFLAILVVVLGLILVFR
jgi:CheY-like chemotaxis protein